MRVRSLIFLIIITLVAATAYGRWFKDKEYFSTESFGEVVFSHDNHLEAVGKNCEECHNKIYNIVTKKNPTFTMEDMEQGKSCGACHNGTRAFSVKDCMSCHAGDLKWKKGSLESRFSHSLHISMEYSCDECHPDLFKPEKGGQKMTMSAMNKGEYCGACHDGDTAFSVKGECGSCHSVGDVVWQKGTLESTFSHKVHLDMDYICDECHPDLFKAKKGGQKMLMNAMYKGEYCGACHDGDTAFSVKTDCGTCHTVGDIAWQKGTLESKFSHNVHLGMDYSCSECHPDLFKAKKGGQKMLMDAMYEGEYCGACHDGDTAFSVKTDCLTCHSEPDDITWKNDNIGETMFSHSIHLGMDYGCGECHPDLFKAKKGGQKMTMGAMDGGEYCGACHDGDTAFSVKGDCTTCHTSAVDISWQKDTIGETVFSHSVHLGMDYSCGECHSDLFKPKKGGQQMTMEAMYKGEYCGACHDGDTAFSAKEACTSCHTSAIDISWQKENIGETKFSHSAHLGMDYSCGDCHPDLFKPKKNGQQMDMNAMSEGEYCGGCHDGDTAFSVKTDCTSCHAGDLVWENKAIGDTHFSHAAHLAMEFFCDACHPDLFKPKHKGQEMKMRDMSKGEYCGACHDGDTAFSSKRDCKVCHKKK